MTFNKKNQTYFILVKFYKSFARKIKQSEGEATAARVPFHETNAASSSIHTCI
jgi:hypothetical protein